MDNCERLKSRNLFSKKSYNLVKNAFTKITSDSRISKRSFCKKNLFAKVFPFFGLNWFGALSIGVWHKMKFSKEILEKLKACEELTKIRA
jgi:hypothetical protein